MFLLYVNNAASGLISYEHWECQNLLRLLQINNNVDSVVQDQA